MNDVCRMIKKQTITNFSNMETAIKTPAPILTQLPAKEKRPAQRSGAGLHPARDCGMLDARKKGVRAKRAESGLHRPDL